MLRVKAKLRQELASFPFKWQILDCLLGSNQLTHLAIMQNNPMLTKLLVSEALSRLNAGSTA
uniref:Uncharacterized protein n=1 Tax=Tetranychus urticae TaxID=32264 RepID=T1KD68_TETUR